MNKEFIVPTGIDESIEGTKWTWRIKAVGSDFPMKSGCSYNYPEWLGDGSLHINEGKGLYIWAARNGDYCRFIHVGISERGKSTVARRTKSHFRGQLNFTDRVHHIEWRDRFGSLGKDLRNDKETRDDAIRDFLSRLEIIYLFPQDNRANKGIRTMEGVISHAAAFLLDQEPARGKESSWETTNTLSKHSQWKVTPQRAALVADMLNQCIDGGILPICKRY